MVYMFLILLIYNLLFLINTKLDEYIENKVLDELQAFYDANNIIFDNREELMVEALTYRLIAELQSGAWVKYIPILGIYNNIKSIHYLKEDIGDYEFFLVQCYGDLLFSHKKEEKKKEKAKQEYFISIEKNNKYLTIWFQYDGIDLNIIDACKTVKELPLKEQYRLLYEGLENVLNKRAKINHSIYLDKILDDNMLQVVEDKFLGRKLLK